MEQCSWMKKPPHLRYPRHPSLLLPDPTITMCINRLWQWQENGELYFVLYEGLGVKPYAQAQARADHGGALLGGPLAGGGPSRLSTCATTILLMRGLLKGAIAQTTRRRRWAP